jgi:CRP-like cAMP-binding protein
MRVYDPGQIIFHLGDPGDSMYVIHDGEVIIRLDDREDAPQLARLGKGEFFGEMALVDDSPRSASAVAGSGGAHILAIDTPHFIYLVSQQPAFALVMLGVMARRLRSKNGA